MPSFQKLDAFVKTRHDMQSRSALGGVITIIAGVTTACLFLAEIYVYFGGFTRHSLHLTTSMSIPTLPIVVKEEDGSNTPVKSSNFMVHLGKISVEASVIFPHMPCNQLDFTMGEGSFSYVKGTIKHAYGVDQVVTMRPPTRWEMKMATNNQITRAPGKQQTNDGGCAVYAKLRVPMNAGEFSVTVEPKTWRDATTRIFLNMMNPLFDMIGTSTNTGTPNLGLNMTYFIQHVKFSKGQKSQPGSATALERSQQIIENDYGGLALQQIQVRLIPTIYRNWLSRGQYSEQYQASVVEHTVNPDTLMGQGIPLRPGLTISYDFSPLAVHQVDMRDNMFVFIGNLISIAGGVFITVGLVVGCVFNTAAAAVSKKVD